MPKIFRLKENVPDIYVRDSRDFQTMCNTFDIINSSVKHDIDTMPNILDTTFCSDAVLSLLQHKLGFYTKEQFSNREIRSILTTFKRLVKDKGSRIGINEAIELYLKIVGISGQYRVSVVNTTVESIEDKDVITPKYILKIELATQPVELNILKEILKYIIPTGYKVEFGFYTQETFEDVFDLLNDKPKFSTVATVNNSRVFSVDTSKSPESHVSTTHTYTNT